MRRSLPLLGLLCSTLAGCGPADLPPWTADAAASDAALLDDVERYLERLEAEGYGGIVGVRLGGEERVIGLGPADRERGVPFSRETLVPIGSVTKGVLGVMLARLAADGELDVRAPLASLVNGELALPGDRADLSLHELLTHTAGFPPSLGPDDERLTRDGFWSRAMAADLETRGEYRYSNVGFSVAAAVVEVLRAEPHGQTLAGLLAEAGIRSFSYGAATPGDVAVGYRGNARWGTLLERPRLDDGPGWNLRGNGGLLATIPDVLRWRGWVNDQDSAVRDRALAQHVAFGDPGDGLFYGYGWDVRDSPRDTRWIDHDGGNGVFYARVTWWTDEDAFLVTASNESSQSAEELHRVLARALIARLTER